MYSPPVGSFTFSTDDELKSIFTLDFIRKIVFNDWWIIPTFDKGYYEYLSTQIK